MLMPDKDALIQVVSEEFNPEDVFTTEQLEAWAEGVGFKKEE